MNVKSTLKGLIAPQNMGRTFFIFCLVSTISTNILLLWKILKKHWRLKNTLLLGIASIYGVAIYGRRIDSKRKKVLFLTNFYDSHCAKFSKRRTYSLGPFYQHYFTPWSNRFLKIQWKPHFLKSLESGGITWS